MAGGGPGGPRSSRTPTVRPSAPPPPRATAPGPSPARVCLPRAGGGSVTRNQSGVGRGGAEITPEMHGAGERTHFVQSGPRVAREFLDCLGLSPVMSITPCERHLLGARRAVARLPAVRGDTWLPGPRPRPRRLSHLRRAGRGRRGAPGRHHHLLGPRENSSCSRAPARQARKRLEKPRAPSSQLPTTSLSPGLGLS